MQPAHVSTTTIASLLSTARERLSHFDSGALEAEILLAHALQKPRSYLHTWPEASVDDVCAKNFTQYLQRRTAGEPVAYLTGLREFWSLNLSVAPGVLIPRPETEELVELALQKIPPDHEFCVADLGTGSGAIALALASERPHTHIIATDLSPTALKVSRQNITRSKSPNVSLIQGYWCDALPDGKFDLIVSNPPYVADTDPHLDDDGVRFEPRTALAAGADGLDDYRVLIPQAIRCLRPGGWLLLEHGFEQQAAVQELLKESGFTEVQGIDDHAGQPRICMACKPH